MSTTSDREHAADGRLEPSFLLLVYANAFITGAVVMGFEMLGSRYLNPFFGSGIYTWAALISTVLAALTAGYFLGGWMADRNPRPSGLGWLIVGGSAYLAFIPLFADGLLELISSLLGGLSDQREFERWGSIAGAMLLLFVPLGLLGVYSPYAIRLTLRATARSGTVAGRIYGISTLGSIFGTLFVTFYLIPTMGSRHITYLLSAIGIAAGLSFLVARPARARRVLPAAALAAMAVLAFPDAAPGDPPARIQPVQAGADAKAMAERFLAFLKKDGGDVQHGGIEAAPRGFRIKDLVLVGRDKVQLKAASFAAASFEERAGGEVALGAIEILDLALAGADKTSAAVARLSAESLAFVAGSRVAVTRFAARDIALTTPKGDLVRMATMETALFRLEAGAGGALERLAIRGITSKGKDESGSIGAIDAESVLVELPRRAAATGVAVRDIAAEMREGAFRIASMELRAFESVNLLDRSPADLRALEFTIKGLEAPFDSAKDPAFARDMRELGYTMPRMSAEIAYRYEDESKVFNLGKLELDVADMGAVTLALRIGGVSADEIKKALEPPPPPPQNGQPPGQRPPQGRQGAAAMGLLARLNLLSGDLSYRDKSILARVIKREAQRRQTDEASIRAQYRALLTGLRDEQSDPLVRESFDAVIAFFDDPGELLIEVRPPAPLNLLAIGALAASNPAQLRAILGMKVTAKKPQR